RNSPYKSTNEFLLGWRNGAKKQSLVTTTHLFWPNHRRKAVSSLRNWQPNPADRLRRERNRAADRGGGVGCVQADGAPRPKSAHGILSVINPLLHSCCS